MSMTSDSSFWMKFLRESELTADERVLLQYSAILSNRFATIEQLLAADEHELLRLGFSNQSDRLCLVKQAQLLDDKENLPLSRQSTAMHEHWLGNNQSTPVNPQSKCNLSPALLSRISFNSHLSDDESTITEEKSPSKRLPETPKRLAPNDESEKIEALLGSRQKLTSPASARGMRAIKSLSDTVSLQKKILAGTDRLKRLTLPRSLLKRQTAMLSKKVSNLTNKLITPLSKIISKSESKRSQPVTAKEDNTSELMQASSRHGTLRRSTDLLARIDVIDGKSTGAAQPLPGKRFKLGAPTTFLTRSLATHVANE